MTDLYLILILATAVVIFSYRMKLRPINLGEITSRPEYIPVLTFNPSLSVGSNVTVSYTYLLLPKKKVMI